MTTRPPSRCLRSQINVYVCISIDFHALLQSVVAHSLLRFLSYHVIGLSTRPPASSLICFPDNSRAALGQDVNPVVESTCLRHIPHTSLRLRGEEYLQHQAPWRQESGMNERGREEGRERNRPYSAGQAPGVHDCGAPGLRAISSVSALSPSP
jgi:hypothetical protein